jgi:hemoglobin
MTALHEQIGEARVRAVLEDFYDRVFSDVMIGYLFARVRGDRARLVERELELTMGLLGARSAYAGKPMREAHRALGIMGGQFDRRLQLLRETIADHDVPDEVARAWLEHAESMRPLIVTGPCGPGLPVVSDEPGGGGGGGT